MPGSRRRPWTGAAASSIGRRFRSHRVTDGARPARGSRARRRPPDSAAFSTAISTSSSRRRSRSIRVNVTLPPRHLQTKCAASRSINRSQRGPAHFATAHSKFVRRLAAASRRRPRRKGGTAYSVFDSDVVQAFRPARHGGPKGPHYIKIENALSRRTASARAPSVQDPDNRRFSIAHFCAMSLSSVGGSQPRRWRLPVAVCDLL